MFDNQLHIITVGNMQQNLRIQIDAELSCYWQQVMCFKLVVLSVSIINLLIYFQYIIKDIWGNIYPITINTTFIVQNRLVRLETESPTRDHTDPLWYVNGKFTLFDINVYTSEGGAYV